MSFLHLEPDALRLATMINMSKEGQIAAVYYFEEPPQRLLYRKWAKSGQNTFGRRRSFKPNWITHAFHASPVSLIRAAVSGRFIQCSDGLCQSITFLP